jgi:hypothetical protein
MAWRGPTRQPWEAVRVQLPQPKPSARGGRPCVVERRDFEGILWMLWTSSHWSELLRRYGSPGPVGGGSSHGKKRASCSSSGAPIWPNSMTESNSAQDQVQFAIAVEGGVRETGGREEIRIAITVDIDDEGSKAPLGVRPQREGLGVVGKR